MNILTLSPTLSTLRTSRMVPDKLSSSTKDVLPFSFSPIGFGVEAFKGFLPVGTFLGSNLILLSNM